MNVDSRPAINWQRLLRRNGTLIGFLLLVIIIGVQRPNTFMTITNWLTITQQVSILGVVAFAMTVVMVMGDFDLSVGTLASLSAIVAAVLLRAEYPIPLALGLALLVGIGGGLINGIVISYLGISPFVASLGTLTIFSGIAFIVSDGKTIFGRAIPQPVKDFATGGITLFSVGNQTVMIPNLTIVAFITLIAIWILLEQTVFGRRLYAIGGNREAARLGGVRVRLLRMIAFVFTGAGAALAGVMLVSRLGSANPTQGDGLMLNAIAAVFLGMTMSEEGEPHVLGTLVGVLILGVLTNGLTQLNVDSYVQQILTGAIIILAVLLSSLSRR
ncbi:MAG: ABC transporter permease [Anaerolineae bacterium]|nr:ABC transporter permease [Anaerolineae bacterium]